MKKFLKSMVSTVCSFFLTISCGAVKAKDFIIALDPGHGGSPGCVYSYDGEEIKEKDLNLKIALYLKDILETYQTIEGDHVSVCLTRNDDTSISNKDRVTFAKQNHAQVLISLHNNAHANREDKRRGCMVIVTGHRSKYGRNCLYDIEEGLARSIIGALGEIGIKPVEIELPTAFTTDASNKLGEYDGGLFRRFSDDGTTYKDGSTTDWYGISMYGVLYNIPSIIVEHAYLSVEEDYREFLSSDEKLRKLAEADADGIASYYNLVKVPAKEDSSTS